MKFKKNEQGYALVTVLLLVTIFMIIILSVMGQSFNTVSQNKVVEKNSQSVSLAEMGVSYYQRLAKSAYLANKDTIISNIQNEIINDQKNDNLNSDNQYYTDNASSQLITAIRQDIEKSINNNTEAGKKEVDTNASYFVKIIEPDATSPKNSLIIEVTGFAKGDLTGKTLSTTISVSPTLTDDTSIDNITPFLSVDFNTTLNSTGLNKCTNPLLPSISTLLNSVLGLDDLVKLCPNADIFLNGTLNIGNENNNGYNFKKFYLTDKLNLDGNINNLQKVILHADNLLTIKGNANNNNNGQKHDGGLTLESMKDAIFEKQVDLKGSSPKNSDATPSHLYVGNFLTANMGLNLYGGSTAFIGEGAKILNGLDLENQSRAFIGVKDETTIDSLKLLSGSIAYIGGNANIGTNGSSNSPAALISNLTMDTNAILCVTGILNVDASVDMNKKQVYTPANDIDNKCKFNVTTTKQIGFDDSKYSQKVDYNYFPK